MEETTLIYSILSGGTLIGIYLVAIIANVFPGIPEEATLLLIGYGIERSGIYSPYLVVFLILGFFTTDILLFALARSDYKIITRLRKKFFKESLEGKEDFVRRHERKIIFFSRFILYFRWIGPVLSGWVKTNWKTFLLFDLLALTFYVPLMLWLGGYFHNRIDRIISGINVAGNIIGALLFIAIFAIFAIGARKWFMRLIKNPIEVSKDALDKSKTFLGISKIEDTE